MELPTQDKEAMLTPSEVQNEINDYIRHNGLWVRPQTDDKKWNWDELIILKAQIAKLEQLGYYKGLPSSVEEALNSGDGTYRP